jgi:hypothetical protein
LPQVADKHALSDLVSGCKPRLRHKASIDHENSTKKMKITKLKDGKIAAPIVIAVPL